MINNIVVKIIGEESLIVYMGLNLILSTLVKLLNGFEEPLACSNIIWIIISIRIAKGKMKCREKNRISVGFSIEGPPHNHTTIPPPQIGIADRVPVITAAPQRDICPHGRTYPKKAVAMVNSKIITPEAHVLFWFLGEEK